MNFISVSVIWVFIVQVLDLCEMGNAGNRLVAALSLVSRSSDCKKLYFFFLMNDGHFVLNELTEVTGRPFQGKSLQTFSIGSYGSRTVKVIECRG